MIYLDFLLHVSLVGERTSFDLVKFNQKYSFINWLCKCSITLSNEPINNITVRTKPFSSGNVSIIFAIFHSFCPQLSFFKMTLSFCWKFLLVDDHFCLSCNDNKNSLRHRLQNSLPKCCTLLHSLLPGGSIITFDFIVKRLAGENVTSQFS